LDSSDLPACSELNKRLWNFSSPSTRWNSLNAKKGMNVQQTESRSDFQLVPDGLTLTQAADILKGEIVVAENR
jgi:hypothetical protein